MLVDESSFAEAMARIEQYPALAVDTETTGLRVFDQHRLCGISIGHERDTYYLPFRHGSGRNLPLDWLPRVIDVIQSKPWYGWNSKFDLHVFLQDGYVIPKPHLHDEWSPVEDVMQAAHLVNENERSYGLKQLADKYLGPESSRDEDELRVHVEARHGKQRKGEWKGLMWTLEPELVTAYAESDVDLTWRMRDFYLPALEAWDLLGETPDESLYDRMNKYMLLFARMEAKGVLLDVERLDELERQAREQMEAERQLIFELTDGAVSNPGSDPQMRNWLGAKSVAKDVLQQEYADDPVAKARLRYKAAEKAVGSYLSKYRQSVYPDGRIRPSYNVIGTYTGRVSCSDPNLQAVPRYDDSEEAGIIRRVKDVFVADPGYLLGEFDLSQAELRIASHYGALAMVARCERGDTKAMRYQSMLASYEKNGATFWLSPMGQILQAGDADLHQETAERIGTDRNQAKRINFSAVFGIGYKKYAATYHIDPVRAKKDLYRWHEQFPEFRELLTTMELQAETTGVIRLETGRWRRYDTPGTDPHAASSNLVQGTVSEIIRESQLRIDHDLSDQGVELLLQVHDSVLTQIPADHDPALVDAIKHRMTDYVFSVDLKSDAKIGDRWGQAH